MYVALQRCKGMDIHCSGERVLSGPAKGATEGSANFCLSVLNPARTDFPLSLQTKRPFNTISDLEAADQSPLSDCLVASGC